MKISALIDQVIYIGLFLTRKALEWFKPYLMEIQANGLATINQEVRYMFLSWEGFVNRIMQIYGDLEAIMMAE